MHQWYKEEKNQKENFRVRIKEHMDTIKNLQQEINSLKKTNIKLKRKTSTSEDNYRSTLATPTPTVARSRLPSETSTIKVNLKKRLQYKSSALSLNVRPHKVAECAKWLVNNSDLYKEEGITFNDSWLEGCSNISLVDDSDECSERLENVDLMQQTKTLVQTVRPNRLEVTTLTMKMTGVKTR